jgi:hypothetical protein
MKKTSVIEGVLQMRFEDIYRRYDKQELSTKGIAGILRISVRTLHRKT